MAWMVQGESRAGGGVRMARSTSGAPREPRPDPGAGPRTWAEGRRLLAAPPGLLGA